MRETLRKTTTLACERVFRVPTDQKVLGSTPNGCATFQGFSGSIVQFLVHMPRPGAALPRNPTKRLPWGQEPPGLPADLAAAGTRGLPSPFPALHRVSSLPGFRATKCIGTVSARAARLPWSRPGQHGCHSQSCIGTASPACAAPCAFCVPCGGIRAAASLPPSGPLVRALSSGAAAEAVSAGLRASGPPAASAFSLARPLLRPLAFPFVQTFGLCLSLPTCSPAGRLSPGCANLLACEPGQRRRRGPVAEA